MHNNYSEASSVAQWFVEGKDKSSKRRKQIYTCSIQPNSLTQKNNEQTKAYPIIQK